MRHEPLGGSYNTTREVESMRAFRFENCLKMVVAHSMALAIAARVVAQAEPPPTFDSPCWLDENGNFNPDAFPPPTHMCPAPDGPPSQVCNPAFLCSDPANGPIPYFVLPGPNSVPPEVINWNFPDPDDLESPCDFEEWFTNTLETEPGVPPEVHNPGWDCRVNNDAKPCFLKWARWHWEEFLGGEPCDDGGGGSTPNPDEDGQPETEQPGPGEGEANNNPCNKLLSGDPIDLVRGSKSEFNEDLRVILPGPDFIIERHDTSDPNHTGPGLVGKNQMLTPFIYMNYWAGFVDPGLPQLGWRHNIKLVGISASRQFRHDVTVIGPNPGDPP